MNKVSGGTANIQADQSDQLTNGLVGYWPLNGSDISGTTAYDRSGQGNNGTLVNGPTTTIGKVGQALNFDGTNDFVSLPNATELKPSGDFSVAFWYKGLKGSKESFVSHSPSVMSNFWEILDTQARFCGTGSCGTSTGKTYTLPSDNEWHHLSVVLDRGASPDELTVYIDGVSQGTATGTADGASTSGWGANTLIGGPQWTNSGYRRGPVDEVRIYNRALSAAETWDLYQLGNSDKVNSPLNNLQTSDLVGLWSFNGPDVSGITAYDRSGQGNNGTLVNGPVAAIGQSGQGLKLDGSDDYVTVADADSLDMTDNQDFALSGWFKRESAATDDTILAKRNGVAAGDQGYIAYLDDATDKFTFAVSDGTDGYQIGSSSKFTDTDWHHFVLAWDDSSSSDTLLYIDGSYETTVATGTFGDVGSLANALSLRIGAESDGGNPFDGKLDEIRIHKRTLTATEVWDQYAASTSNKRTCGTVTDEDGNIYGTVVIGSQCWMKQNMRVGTSIAAVTDQTDNGIIEKYCRNDVDTSCANILNNQPEGGYYQWNEAMRYVTTVGARGICPQGFHIPTDAEQYTLENYLKDAGQSCDANRSSYSCDTAGLKMNFNSTTGFEMNFMGYAQTGSFYFVGMFGTMWSSSESNATRSWFRNTSPFVNSIWRGTNPKSYGLPVRCLQDQ